MVGLSDAAGGPAGGCAAFLRTTESFWLFVWRPTADIIMVDREFQAGALPILACVPPGGRVTWHSDATVAVT